jgi:hypothetical protein
MCITGHTRFCILDIFKPPKDYYHAYGVACAEEAAEE